MPKAKFVRRATPSSTGCRRCARPREIEMSRAAAQLISIGTQAAYHVTDPGVTDAEIYAAFTFAQLARGGETGDGYQIGINEYGTHCGKPYGQVVRAGRPDQPLHLQRHLSGLHRPDGPDDRRRRRSPTGRRRCSTPAPTASSAAEKLIRPGALVQRHQQRRLRALHRARPPDARPRRGPCPTTGHRRDDGGPRLVPRQYVPIPTARRRAAG